MIFSKIAVPGRIAGFFHIVAVLYSPLSIAD
jgi:hypothetical protein